jgi:trk system potassium uptake protein TrkH
MNFSAIFSIIGSLLLVLGFSMLISMGWSIHHNENDIMAFVYSIAITLGVGILLKIITKPKGHIGIRDSFLIVTLGWTLASIFGALPFIFSGTVNNFVDGFFETVSGFTTTGATIINDVENLSHGILFWRSFTQWLGGMGIIVLFIALLPKISSGSFQLFRAEVPGPTAERITPRITQTAKVLWLIYVGISLLQTILLLFVGFTLFDALTHTFATVATGGFSTRNLSIGAFNNPSAEIIITIFMIIAGGNFSLYYFFLKGNWQKLTEDKEFRFYVIIILIPLQ